MNCPRFFAALAEESDATLRDFFLPESYWRIPETKNGQPVYVHLPPAAVALLDHVA
jgi:hypothetical protein